MAPELTLATLLPREFEICETDNVDLEIRVSNTGSGTTSDVVVEAKLPEGLSYEGRSVFRHNVGTLKAGERKKFNAPLKVHAPGRYAVQATAKSNNGMSTDAATVTLTARESDLQVQTAGPSEEYLGIPVEYEILVRNDGSATAREVKIESVVPTGAELVDASSGGKLDGNLVHWEITELPAGQTALFRVRYESQDGGVMRNVVTAKSLCSSDTTAIARTKLRGVASMVVEVVDTEDPIKVGDEEVYKIRVTNQGSAPETNVMVECTIPGEMRLVSANGASETNGNGRSDDIYFRPLRELKAGETAEWEVKVQRIQPGDLRFAVTVDSDQHNRPVRETEATRVFN